MTVGKRVGRPWGPWWHVARDFPPKTSRFCIFLVALKITFWGIETSLQKFFSFVSYLSKRGNRRKRKWDKYLLSVRRYAYMHRCVRYKVVISGQSRSILRAKKVRPASHMCTYIHTYTVCIFMREQKTGGVDRGEWVLKRAILNRRICLFTLQSAFKRDEIRLRNSAFNVAC